MADRKRIEVAVAIITDGRRLLIARRPEGVPLAGYWEFPGGKLEPGETPEAAAAREVLEELAVTVLPIVRLTPLGHDYPHARVWLMPVLCRWTAGDPRPIGCAEARWILPADLPDYAFPPANASLVHAVAGLPLRNLFECNSVPDPFAAN